MARIREIIERFSSRLAWRRECSGKLPVSAPLAGSSSFSSSPGLSVLGPLIAAPTIGSIGQFFLANSQGVRREIGFVCYR